LTNFLVEVDGEDVATIRYTAKRDGTLESEEQNESWRSFIESSGKDPYTICELARWLVRQDFRATRVALIVGRVAHEHCMSKGTFNMYCWAKTGPLAAYYKRSGHDVCIEEPFPFKLGDYLMGLNLLMYLDFGSPWSLRRTSMRLRYGFLRMLGAVSVPLQKVLLRRGRGCTHKS
jgi:hypothetical protein